MDLKAAIRDIPDFPQEGVLFRDITTLLKEPVAMVESVDQMMAFLKDVEFDLILGPESRGFIYGMPIAYTMKKGFVPVRKAGKLPAEVISQSYDLEYGSAVIEIHKDAIKAGDKVVIIDDLLATGGTAKAMVDLVESVGASVVSLNFLIELDFLDGRKLLADQTVNSVLHY